MHKVSVIIPIYNVEEYLPKCLDSVINQTYKDLEIICVNDCSPDNCDRILQEYAAKDERLKIINREKNGGLSAARNTGMDAATGEYIYFIDSDDWIDDDYIEKMVEAAVNNNAEVVLNTNILLHKADKTPWQHMPQYTMNFAEDQFLDAQSCILNIIWNTWAYLWKKSFLDRINARFPEGYVIEDIYFQATTLVYLNQLYIIRNGAYHYIQRPSSIMGSLSSKSLIPIIKIMNKIYDYYSSNNLIDKISVCLISNMLLPNNNSDKLKQCILLKDYFSKIYIFVRNNQNLYSKTALTLFEDVLNNIPKALQTDYTKLALLEKLRNHINKQNSLEPANAK